MAAQSKYLGPLRTCPSAAEIRLLILNGGQRQRKRNRSRRREREKDQEEEVSDMEDAMASRPEPERGVGAQDSPSHPEGHRNQASTADAEFLQAGVNELSDRPRRTQLSTEAGWKKAIIRSLTRRLSAASSGPEQERSPSAPKLESKALQPAFQTPAEAEQTGTGGTASEAGMEDDPALTTDTPPATASATAADSFPVTDLAAAATSAAANVHTQAAQTSIAAHDLTVHARRINGVCPALGVTLDLTLPRPRRVKCQVQPWKPSH